MNFSQEGRELKAQENRQRLCTVIRYGSTNPRWGISYLLGNTDLGLADPDLLPEVLECQSNWHLDFSFFLFFPKRSSCHRADTVLRISRNRVLAKSYLIEIILLWH